jgi:hypothetical protein
MIATVLLAATAALAGPWRGALDLAGGTLKFGIELEGSGPSLRGRLCNGSACDAFSAVAQRGDSVVLELADYAASITAVQRGDSLVGVYRNVGSRGPNCACEQSGIRQPRALKSRIVPANAG